MRHLLVSTGATPVRDLDMVNAYEIQAGGTDRNSIIDRLREKPGVDYIEENPQFELDAVPNDPVWAKPISENHWGLHNDNFGTPDADIDVTEAWNVSTGSDGVVVAVIDTGADYNHADLRGNIWVNAGEVPGNGVDDDGDGLVDNVNGYDFGDNDPDPYDDGGSDTGHGTAVTGIIGAAGNNGIGVTGVNWHVKVMVLKFTGTNGMAQGASRDVADMLVALDSAIKKGAVAVNMSFGSAEACNSQALQNGLNAAEAAGVLLVASAGNNRADTDISPHCPSGSANSNIIAVANSDENDNLTSTSNYGRATVDLTAPGRHILSTVPGGYAHVSGTSFSTPFVTGAVALLKSMVPQASAAQIRDAILRGVDQRPQLAGLVATGGRLNMVGAMRQIDTVGPSATMKLNNGKKYTRKRKIAIKFTDVYDSSGIKNMSFTAGKTSIKSLTPFAATSTVKLDKKEGTKIVRATLSDNVDNSTSLQGKIKYDRTLPRKFRIKSVKVKKKRGSKVRRVVVRWKGARDRVSGVRKYRIYRGSYRRTSSKIKSKGKKRIRSAKKRGKRKRCHFRKVKVVSRKRRKTVIKIRSRGRQCIRVEAVDRAGNGRRSPHRKATIR